MSHVSAASLPVAIAPADLAELTARRADVMVLDVRAPAEYESTHIPGSYNVPLDLLPEHAVALGAVTGGPVVLVCRSGFRARQAEQVLGAAGLPRLHVLDGGLAAWEGARLPLNRGRQRWGIERQVRGVAGGLGLAGALAGLVLWRPLGAVAAAIGGGLFVSAITDSCVMASLLAKLPYNRGAAVCDVEAVVRALGQARETSSPLAAD